jgi:hypothetical protein
MTPLLALPRGARPSRGTSGRVPHPLLVASPHPGVEGPLVAYSQFVAAPPSDNRTLAGPFQVVGPRPPLEAQKMAIRTTRNAGMLLLGIWLILMGLGAFITLPIPPIVTGVLALISGILILLGM